MSGKLEIGGFSFEVKRSPRRNTLGLVVDRNSRLVIQAPQSTSDHELARWAKSKLIWIHRKLAIKEQVVPKVGEPEFVSGESFKYLGRSYRLNVKALQDVPFRFDGRSFFLRADAQPSARDYFRSWYVAVGSQWIEQRVELLAARTGTKPSRVEVGDLGFRWGCCGKGRAVFFNWRLLQLPVRLVDYVIVHELGHLVEHHHGPAFRRLLDRCMPDWKNRKEELRTKANEIHWCRPASFRE